MKNIKSIAYLILIIVLLSAIAVFCWLYQPYDKTAWRVPVKLPVLGSVRVRAFPLYQLATLPASKALLNGTQWSTKFGVVKYLHQDDAIQLNCQSCEIYLASFSNKAVHFDEVNLTIHPADHQINGKLMLLSQHNPIEIKYAGVMKLEDLSLRWTLPKTPIAHLLSPLKTHAIAIDHAQVTGNFSAFGTLHWPSRRWTAKPNIEQFSVTGLETEKFKSNDLTYVCPQPNQSDSNKAVTPQVWLKKKHLGRWLPMAVLIAEDAQFMHHRGYDLDSLNYILAQETPYKKLGGSTISQQLAKYFFTSRERLWVRKVEELLYAVEMERTLGKERIFEIYLNTLDWGPSICGAYDAAKFYFSLHPAQLNPIQAAWLAGIIRSPHRAWTNEFLKNEPDYERVKTIIRYMPRSASATPLTLDFTKPKPLSAK